MSFNKTQLYSYFCNFIRFTGTSNSFVIYSVLLRCCYWTSNEHLRKDLTTTKNFTTVLYFLQEKVPKNKGFWSTYCTFNHFRCHNTFLFTELPFWNSKKHFTESLKIIPENQKNYLGYRNTSPILTITKEWKSNNPCEKWCPTINQHDRNCISNAIVFTWHVACKRNECTKSYT